MIDRARLEEALALEEELAKRRETDPLVQFQPTPKQRPFIDAVLSGKYFDVWFVAANRAGKSDAGAYAGSQLARYGVDDPGIDYGDGIEVRDHATSGWVVSLDYNTSRDTIQPKYFNNGYGSPGTQPFIPDREVVEWPTQHNPVLKLKNGSIIGFRHCSQDRVAFQGAEKDWIHFDEEPDFGVWQESVIRVGKRKLRVFGTCTLLPPEGQLGGVSWLFSEVIQPWQEGQRPDSALFGSSIYDNLHIPAEEVRRLEAMYPEGSLSRRIRLDGEWLPGMAGSRAYTGFHRSLHVNDLGGMQERRPLAWIWDFNVEPMVSLIGQRNGRVFEFHDEIILEEGNIADMVEQFVERYPRHGAELYIYGDATGKARHHHSNRSSYQLILNEMKAYRAPCRLKVPESNPPVKDRLNAVNRLFKDEFGEVRIQVDPRCKELIADFEGVLTDRQGKIKKTNDRKDPYYRRTHTCLRGDTPVLTPSGWCPVQDIAPGDQVTTPAGDARVLHAGPVEKRTEMVRVVFEDGREIVATPEHKFFTERGLVTSDALRYSDRLLPPAHPLCVTAASSLRESDTTGLREAVTTLAGFDTKERTPSSTCIERYTSIISARFRRGCASITKITTGWTIAPKISNSWFTAIMPAIMESTASGPDPKPIFLSSKRLRNERRSGTLVTRDENGTASTPGASQPIESGMRKCVLSVVRLIARRIRRDRCTAIRIAKLQRFDAGGEWTYDLTVEKHQCYVANGVLVSNSDAAGYWLAWEEPVRSLDYGGSSRSGYPPPKNPGYSTTKR